MRTTWRERWLAFPRAQWLALGLGLLVGLPTLGMGFVLDDQLQLLMHEGRWPLGSPGDLFRFAGGSAEGMRRIVQEGPYPWWTLQEANISFWRPLSSALATLDHRLFGRDALGPHLHSLAWYLAVVALVGLLLRGLLPGAVGALALLLFTVDDTHFMAAGWLANRNALVSMTGGLLGLWLHLRWRESGHAWARPLSLGALALGLAGGESATGLFAYLLAYEVLGARGSRAERLRALAPVVGLGAVWLTAYKSLGFGAHGSSYYLDPVGEPVRYLVGALGRVPALAGGLLGVPVDFWALKVESRPVLVALGLAGVALMGALLRSAWPGLCESERRHCRWLALGALLSLLPVAASQPMSRLLLVPSLGAMVVLAVVLRHAWRSPWRGQGWRGGGLAVAGLVLALFNGVLAPLSWPAMGVMVRRLNEGLSERARQVASELEVERLPSQRVVLLANQDPLTMLYVPVQWALAGSPLPRSWWTLSMAAHEHLLTRTGPASFELELQGGRFLASELEQTMRDGRYRLRQGARVELEGMRVTVLAEDAQGPTRLGFEFDTPLEDPSLVFLHWREGQLRRYTPPPPGARDSLSPPFAAEPGI